MRRLSALLLATLLVSACDRSPLIPYGPLTGSWIHAELGPGGAYADIQLTQVGTQLSGTVVQYGAAGFEVIDRAPLAGRYTADSIYFEVSSARSGHGQFWGVLVADTMIQGLWNHVERNVIETWGATRR